MSANPALFDELALALAQVRVRLGDPPFGDRRRTIALLADRVPEARREIRAIGTAIDEGVPQALLASERHLLGLEIDRLSDRLEATTGLRGDLAKPIVRAFSYGLGLGPLPSLYVDVSAPAVAPVVPEQWAGVSQPVHAPPAPVPRPAPAPRKKPAADTIVIGNHPFPRNLIFLGGGLLAALAIGVTVNGMRTEEPAAPVTTLDGQTGQPKQIPPGGLAGEEVNFGVAAKRELEANVGSPTPLEIPVGRRVTTAQLQALIARDAKTLLIDVLAQPHPQTLSGARFVPIGGTAGTVTDGNQAPFAAILKKLSGGDIKRRIVFFCAGAQCWESYNAVLRADAAGYADIYWYRGGLASWAEAALPMSPLPPEESAR